MPTFLRSRLFIDFSSPDAETTNYERLLRRVFDKPEHTKPIPGTPPPFISSEALPANPLSGRVRAYREALRLGRPHASLLFDDYMEGFIQELENRRIQEIEGEPFDETLVRSLEALKPLRDDFIEICDWCLRSSERSDFADRVVPTLDQVRGMGEWPPGIQTWNEMYGENFRIFAHELFLSVIGLLLRRQQFALLAEILEAQFVMSAFSKPHNTISGSFVVFYSHSEVLRKRNQRLELRRLDLQADLFSQRATSRLAPFPWLQQADLVCSVCSLLRNPDERPWYPRTLVFARFVDSFETFKRAESRSFYRKLACLWNGLDPREFGKQLAEAVAKSPAKDWHFDYASPAWEKWLNMERLGSRD